MTNTPWLLLDTETTGSTKPIFTVELAAQRMTGWERDGAPFRLLCRREFHHCELDKGIHHLHPEIRVPIRPSMKESTDSLMNDKGYDLNRSHLCGRATDHAFYHRTQRRAYRGCFFVIATTK